MKLIFAVLLAFCFATSLVAQAPPATNPNAYNAISAKVLAMDYESPNEDLEDLGSAFGLELSYRRQLGKLFGLAVPLKFGVIDVGELENPNIVSIDLVGHLYPAGSNAKIAPYLLGGIGVQAEDFETSYRQIPVGAGLNFKLGENGFLGIQGEYRISDAVNRDNIQIGLGYVYRIATVDNDDDGIVNRLDACPEQPGPEATNGCPDQDMDGVADKDDKCPTLAGEARLEGCPDTDGDGVIDPQDKCPEVAGSAVTMGCPDRDEDGVPDADDECPDKAGTAIHAGCPDSDGDGFYDNQDKCPDEAGPDQGCPPTDTDGDGIPDAEDNCPDAAGDLRGCPDTDDDGIADKDDRCPERFGPASNQGCPEVKQEDRDILEFATQAVQFETGSAKLKSESYFTLGQIVGIMNQYPSYSLIISGHTDNVGNDENNQVLSERRAKTCRDYLVSKGIDASRITYVGYGETRPRESNETASGRRLNRRVEFDLRLL